MNKKQSYTMGKREGTYKVLMESDPGTQNWETMRKKRNGFEGGDIKLVKNTAETGITATEEEPEKMGWQRR